jgi:hypothetical protein
LYEFAVHEVTSKAALIANGGELQVHAVLVEYAHVVCPASRAGMARCLIHTIHQVQVYFPLAVCLFCYEKAKN